MESIKPEHAAAIHELMHQLFVVPYAYDLVTIQTMCRQGSGFIIKHEGKIVALILYLEYPRHMTAGTILTISSLGTHPEFQRRGFAKQLMKAIKTAYPHVDIALHVRISNSKAIALYEQEGFKQTYMIPRFYVDDGEDAYYMVYTADKQIFRKVKF